MLLWVEDVECEDPAAVAVAAGMLWAVEWLAVEWGAGWLLVDNNEVRAAPVAEL